VVVHWKVSCGESLDGVPREGPMERSIGWVHGEEPFEADPYRDGDPCIGYHGVGPLEDIWIVFPGWCPTEEVP
jgi:hypothetical protein